MILNYVFNDYYNNVKLNNIEYGFTIEEDLDDIIAYLFELQYNIPYTVGWMLENDAIEFVQSLRKEYIFNNLKFSDFYNNKEFISWLKTKYYKPALEACYNDIENTNNLDTDEYSMSYYC